MLLFNITNGYHSTEAVHNNVTLRKYCPLNIKTRVKGSFAYLSILFNMKKINISGIAGYNRLFSSYLTI